MKFLKNLYLSFEAYHLREVLSISISAQQSGH